VSVYNHPAFPQPADLNAKIWRYMDFPKFESLVLSQRLYMRRADLFLNDEYEGTTPAGDIEYWRRQAAAAATPEERAAIEGRREQLAEYAETFRKNYFVSCWNMAESENIAMWERYTTGPDSVAVASTYLGFGNQLDSNVMHYGMVRYIDYDTTPLPSINMLQRISHKRHFFADEREVRAVMCAIAPEEIRQQHIDPHVTSDGCGWAPPINVQLLIRQVVLHPRASADFGRIVAELCAERSLPSPSPSKMAGKPRF
jgi:hypothetical protein